MAKPSNWFRADLCPCGWYCVPSFGKKFFSDTDYPVCPECGQSHYDRTLVTGRLVPQEKERWWHFTKRVFTPIDTK